MFKRFLAVGFLVVAISSTTQAGPLRPHEPNYRGAFTILSAARSNGAWASYHTEVLVRNHTNHRVWLRLELYGLNGYSEAMQLNFMEAEGGMGFRWHASLPPGSGVPGDGTDTSVSLAPDVGALRIVAVKEDGSDDLSAKISGYARLWIVPYSGGRLSEVQPGFTDAELVGAHRRGSKAGYGDTALYKPFDATNSNVKVAVVNFDTSADLTIASGPFTTRDVFGNVEIREGFEIHVPPGSTRMVPLQVVGRNIPQALGLAAPSGATNWISYVALVDEDTGDISLRYDFPTTDAMISRK